MRGNHDRHGSGAGVAVHLDLAALRRFPGLYRAAHAGEAGQG